MSMDICHWLFLLYFLTTWTTFTNSKEIRVVCYYTNWSVYRPGTAKFSPQNINPYLCTHLIYAFGGFTKENTLKPFDKYQDIEKGGYAKFTGLKTYNKNLKTMLAIGGWNEGSSRFSPMVASAERRKELVKNAVKFLRQNHFDGLDLDWEYPSFRDGGKTRDRDNYARLVQELREEFDRESEKTGRSRLLLTMAVPAGIEYINKGYDVPKLTKYLDWMNILSYDYHSAFEPAVNHHAPLYSLEEASEYNYDTELNIDYTIQHYLDAGAEANKLVLGIPTYGRSYTLYNPDANEIGAPADGPGDMGDATRENGYLAYYEICENIKSQDWEVVQPNPDAMGPYAYKDNQWVGYDDDAIARKKAEYVVKNDLGGIMFWSIDNDDFRGTCHGRPYPIIEAAKEALITALGLTDENLVSPPAKPIKSKPRTRPQAKPSRDKTADTSDKKEASTSGASRRRNRIKTKASDDDAGNRLKTRRKDTRRTTEGPTYSSLELVTPSYTTPAPPSTPDQGGVFKCEDEGFFPHPKDCKKYYWCLSGPGELGIIAHQFTCPAGLYFNKAADSCDYTRNVLCNKKLGKSSTTTTTTSTEASTSKTTLPTSTKRVPPRITAATSRTTVFRTSTTTTESPYEDEYEDDEEEFDIGRNAEEDPKVIKELLDLIKKAGGIEELEKQLKIQEDGSASISNVDTTTPSSISKSLVERVLGKTAKTNIAGRKQNSYSFINRNSRGPQNEGLSRTNDKDKQDRGRPQYTTIARQRNQSGSEDKEDDEDDEEKEKETARKHPEYVNIRRGRVSTTTEDPDDEERSQVSRNKVLGETDDEDQTEDDDDDDDTDKSTKRKIVTPQYVNIRRQRPTTEEVSTSKYTVIQRGSGTTESANQEELTTPDSENVTTENKLNKDSTTNENNDLKSKYKILRRGSTTEVSIDSTTLDDSLQFKNRRRGTTTPSTGDVTSEGKRRGVNVRTDQESSTPKDQYKFLKRGSTTIIPVTEIIDESPDSSTLRIPISSSTATAKSSDVKQTTIDPNAEIPTTTVEQLSLTSPESIGLKTTLTTRNSLLDQSVDVKLDDSEGSSEDGLSSTEKRPPLLLEPRPFSLSTVGPKTVTESTSRTTKVSESNYRLRVKANQQDIQSDSLSTTILTTEKPTPFRTRASSRFKYSTTTSPESSRSTLDPTVRSRRRFSTTTELNSFDDYDLTRNYRPSEIADLSSLTAVDFATLKGNNRFGGSGGGRQRRPRPTSEPTSTKAAKPDENLKTGARTLPLARKLLNGTTFGKSRRVIPSRSEIDAEDQVKSNSDTTQKFRGFTRTSSPTESSTTESIRPTLRGRKVIRRFRPTTISSISDSSIEPLASINEKTNSFNPLRQRINRLTTTEKFVTVSENLVESASTNPQFNGRFNKSTLSATSDLPTTSSSSTTAGIREEADDQNETSDDVSSEEGENIKLSESNIRENSNVNNDNVLGENDKKTTRKILKRIRSKVNNGKESDDEITKSVSSTEPNIIIRTRKIIRKLRPTEATVSTTTSTDATNSSTLERKRKIIRRFRPTTKASVLENDENSTTSPPIDQKTLFIRGRAYLTQGNVPEEKETEAPSLTQVNVSTLSKIPTIKSESDREEESIGKELIRKFKPNKFKYKPINRSTVAPDNVEDDSGEKNSFISYAENSKFKPTSKATLKSTTTENTNKFKPVIDRSKYGILNRGTTSTTPGYAINSSPIVSTSEEDYNDDAEEYSEEDDRESIPVHRPTLTKYDDEEISSPKYGIFRPTIGKDNEDLEKVVTEQDNDKPKILSSTQDTEDEISEENADVDEDEGENVENSKDESSSQESAEIENEESETVKGDLAEEIDEAKDITTTTTLKPYINPIIERQKKRPAFVRPKITTSNPIRPTPANKPKFKLFSKSTTASPKPDSEVEKQEIEEGEKYNPKTLDKPRYSQTQRQNSTDIISSADNITTLIYEPTTNNSENLNITTTESYNISETTTVVDGDNNTTDTIEATTTYTINEEKNRNISTSITEPVDAETYNQTLPGEEFSEDNATQTDIQNTPPTEQFENITVLLEVENTTLFVNDLVNSTELESNEIINGTAALETTTPTDDLITTTVNSTEESILINETTTNSIETTTRNDINQTTATTQAFELRSTLKSIQSRPKYIVPKKLSINKPESSTIASKFSNRFSQRNRGQFTTSTLRSHNLRFTTVSPPNRNRFSFKFSTTERAKIENIEPEEEYDDDDEEPQNVDDVEEPEEITNSKLPGGFSPRTTAKSKTRVSNRPSGYSSRKSTEIPQVTEDLSDINTEAVKNRNKNLFSKKRKMNTPFSGATPTYSVTNDDKSTTASIGATEAAPITTTPTITETFTKPTTQVFETTEYLTTLHHIFAETEPILDLSTTESTTVSLNEENASKSKVEKLIEVNRIVEVHEKNKTDLDKESKTVDKVGVINRVTVVKVVDGNPNVEDNEIVDTTPTVLDSTSATEESGVNLNINGAFIIPEIATVKEIPNSEIKGSLYNYPNPFSEERQERKYEIYGESKVKDYRKNVPNIIEKGQAEIIDGISLINIITPRPYYSTEASTISLEALFQTDTPQKLNNGNTELLKPTGDDELLETGNSRFVNIRVLGQDYNKEVPKKVLKQEDYITMKAEVVEVTPKSIAETIRIVPIKGGRVTTPFLFRVGGRRKTSPALSSSTTTRITSTPKPTPKSTKLVRRKYQPPTTKKAFLESQEPSTTSKAPKLADSRFRFVSRKPFFRSTTRKVEMELADQTKESSNQQSLEEDFAGNDTTELGDIAVALHELQQAPVPFTSTTLRTTPRRLHPKNRASTRSRVKFSTTAAPILTTRKFIIRKVKPQAFEKITQSVSNTFRPLTEYDYYDESESILGRIPEHSKVLLHSNGVIECLDQGSFPHPVSCKKFISCAKMENGKVLGWEYTCPKNLSFDPIGGICNWSAGLGCNE